MLEPRTPPQVGTSLFIPDCAPVYVTLRPFFRLAGAMANPAKDGFESSRASRCILEEVTDTEDNLLQAADITFGQRPAPAGEREGSSGWFCVQRNLTRKEMICSMLSPGHILFEGQGLSIPQPCSTVKGTCSIQLPFTDSLSSLIACVLLPFLVVARETKLPENQSTRGLLCASARDLTPVHIVTRFSDRCRYSDRGC